MVTLRNLVAQAGDLSQVLCIGTAPPEAHELLAALAALLRPVPLVLWCERCSRVAPYWRLYLAVAKLSELTPNGIEVVFGNELRIKRLSRAKYFALCGRLPKSRVK